MQIVVGGGLESISLVQNDKMNHHRAHDPWLLQHRDAVYMTMLETAEIVAERYKISRERRTNTRCNRSSAPPRAQAAGRFDAEIVPLPSRDEGRRQGERRDAATRPVTLTQDEGNRADTTLAGLAALKPVFAGGRH